MAIDPAMLLLVNNLIDTIGKRFPTPTETAAMDAQTQSTALDMLKHQSDVGYREDVLAGQKAEATATADYREEMLLRTPKPVLMPLGDELATWRGGDPNTQVPIEEWNKSYQMYSLYGKKVNQELFKPFMDEKYFDSKHKDYIDFSKLTPSDANQMMTMYGQGAGWERVMKELKLKKALDAQGQPSLITIKPELYETEQFPAQLGFPIGIGYNESDQLDVFQFGGGTPSAPKYHNLANIQAIQAQIEPIMTLYKSGDPRGAAVVQSLQNMGDELMKPQFYSPGWSSEYTRAMNQLTTIMDLYKTITGKTWKPSAGLSVAKELQKKFPNLK